MAQKNVSFEDDFKRKMQEQESLMRDRSSQISVLQKNVDSLSRLLEEISKKVDTKKAELDSIEEKIKEKHSDAHKSISNTLSALDAREKKIATDEAFVAHSKKELEKAQNNLKNAVQQFNEQKENFKRQSSSAHETLKGAIESIHQSIDKL